MSATIAASRLANPPVRLATGWTACELLLATLAGDVLLENNGFNGVDVCRARDRTPNQRLLFRVNLEYGDDPVKGAQEVRSVAGQRVAVSSDSSGCLFQWNAGPIRVTFHAYDCAKGESLVPKLITSLASPNPDRTSPQRPLLIRPDEPDEPLVGACVDYPYGLSCQPSTDMAVPKGPEAALSAAAADARVACAVAADADRARFGIASTPVLGSVSTERRDCYFVEPTHTTVVEVRVRTDDDLADAIPTGGGQDLTVAGRPAKSASTGNDRRLCVLPVSGAKTGLLCVVAHFLPGRGVETDSPADTSKETQLEPAVTDIVSKHFS